MLKKLFDFVLDNYNNGFKRAERNDPNFKVINDDIPAEIEKIFPNRKDIFSDGSCGIGTKTKYPWDAIFNKHITSSAKKGLYIVYLFKNDMSGFYLSLNQGITYFKEIYRENKFKSARKVADYFRGEINNDYFDKNNIDLGASKYDLGYGYQETNIISKYYKKGEFTAEELIKDLKNMLSIYDELVGVLSEVDYNYDNAIKKIIYDYKDSFEDVVSAIDDIKKSITSPTDINEVRTLRYVEPKEKRTKKYSKIVRKDAIKKTDYVEIAKTDAKIGLLGEKLALEYERERLIKNGLSQWADKIRHVASVSDAFGYDIISYDLIDSKIEEIYIEVKTTTNKLDVDFPISKNEILTSNKKKEHYCIFRIYDVKSTTPSFYKVYGRIEDNFELNPISYLARYVGKKK